MYLIVHKPSDLGTIHLVPSYLSDVTLQERLEFLVKESITT